MVERALSGIRILEVAMQFPGPYCSMILSDLGAEVLKVERFGIGDPARQWPSFFESINRNRRSLSLDLKKAEGKEIFYKLVKDYDVMTEGFRPGVAKKLGIDFETLKAINPRLIYCSISGYGQNGPYSVLPGHDLNYMAMCGMLNCFSTEKGQPICPQVPIADLAGSMFAAIAILAALQHRNKSGKGQYIDCSMFDALIYWMSTILGMLWAQERQFTDHDAGYGIFQTLDGKYLSLGVAHEDIFWINLCDALGLAELKMLKGMERTQKADELASKIGAILRTRTRDEWIKVLIEADVPASPLQALDELINDPHVAARGLIQELLCPGKIIRQITFPMRFSQTTADMRLHPPSLGEHTEEVLTELGYSLNRIEILRRDAVV